MPAPSRLERVTGFPRWSMVGAVGGLLVLGVAMVGLYWDIAWHVDHGRDEELLTTPHALILVGLAGLVLVAGVAAGLATLDEAPVGVRIGSVRVPWSVLLILVFRLGGLAAFFVDDLWHRAYGIDVTLWSPPHLTLLAGGALSAVAVWLMVVEARPWARPTRLGTAVHVVACGSMLVAVSTVQAEFDFGVAQFRALALPVLVAAGGGFVLTMSRVALGPGGALAATVVFLVLRGAVSFVVGALGHAVPGSPLYLPAALAVEAVGRRWGTNPPVRFALLSGALVGTVGLGAEAVWATAITGHRLGVPDWPVALALGTVAAAGSAVLGVSLARAALGKRGFRRPALVLAGLAVAVALAVPVPRGAAAVEADVALDATDGPATVTVRLHPADAGHRATRLDVVAVQGGGRIVADLDEKEPGVFVSSRAVPVGGSWKTLVRLERGNLVLAAPISLPADPLIDAPAVAAATERRVAFGSVTTVLQREAHDGPAWAAAVSLVVLGAIAVVWVALLARASSRFGRLPVPAA